MINKSLAIFINSFDDNHDLWGVCLDVYDYFMPNSHLKRYLVTNTKDFQHDNLEVIKTGDDKNWFTMSLNALESVEEEYVLHILEDQWISKPVSDTALLEIVGLMDEPKVSYYKLTAPRTFPNNQSFINVPKNTPYPISLQPAIWRTSTLRDTLRDLQNAGCKSPWDFERYFIDQYSGSSGEEYLEGVRYDSRNILGYQNALIQGLWDPRVIRVYRKLGLSIDVGDRGYMPFKSVAYDALKRNEFTARLSFENRRRLKSLLKALGFRFMT